MGDRDEFKTLIVDDTKYRTRLTRKFGSRKPWVPADSDRVAAYIPGVICRVFVSPGPRVRRGDPLVVLEAMKMQNTINAPRDGTVKTIAVKKGEIVPKGHVLVELS